MLCGISDDHADKFRRFGEQLLERHACRWQVCSLAQYRATSGGRNIVSQSLKFPRTTSLTRDRAAAFFSTSCFLCFIPA